MLIGYARVSSPDQSLDLQQDALQEAGCERIFTDVISGSKSERKGLNKALNFLREGDTLVVWRLDRVGRSLRHLLELMTMLSSRRVEFRSLQENIDTSTATGKLVFHLFASLAEFERSLLIERTRAGLAAARARGRNGGRPKSLDTKRMEVAYSLWQDHSNSIDDICKSLKISRATLYRYLSIHKRTLRASDLKI